VVEEICRQVIAGAVRERRFAPRAARIDSTVVEADIRYPSDLGLAADATRTLAREAGKAADLAGEDAPHVRDRSRATNRRLRTLNRTLARRTGQGKEMALRLTGEAGELVARSVGETRRLARRLREKARGRGAQAKLAAARRLDDLADRADKVVGQIGQRVDGEKITDRLVSMSDPDARPIRKGKLGAPTEFGYVVQITEVTENTRRGARGVILPAPCEVGSPNESDLLPATGAERDRLGIAPREIALDGGFAPGPVDEHPPNATAHSSLAATVPGPDEPTGAWRATASAPKGASATSSAATACAEAASRATTAPGRGRPGASWPTTSTPSPSEPPDSINPGRAHTRPRPPETPNGRAPHPSAAVHVAHPSPPPFIRGK
jgi:hypothetical protein